MAGGIRVHRALMAALVAIAIISFTVQSILASDAEINETSAPASIITGNAVAEVDESGTEGGGLDVAITKAANWVFG